LIIFPDRPEGGNGVDFVLSVGLGRRHERSTVRLEPDCSHSGRSANRAMREAIEEVHQTLRIPARMMLLNKGS